MNTLSHNKSGGSGKLNVLNSGNIGTDSEMFKNHFKDISGSAAGARKNLDPYREDEHQKFRNFGGRHSSNPHALKNLHHIQKYSGGGQNYQ